MASLSHCLLPDTSQSLQECLTIVLGAVSMCVCVCTMERGTGRDRVKFFFFNFFLIVVKDVDRAMAHAGIQAIFCMNTVCNTKT